MENNVSYRRMRSMGMQWVWKSIRLCTRLVVVAEGEEVQKTVRNKSVDELPPHSPTLDPIVRRLSEVCRAVRRLVTATDSHNQDFILTCLRPCFR